jgi:signal transduction histidine kinase
MPLPQIALSLKAGFPNLGCMSLLTIAWSFCASVCLMLGSIHLLFWLRNRKQPVYLLSSLMAFSAGVSAMLELGLLFTESLYSYRILMRWENVAVFMILVPMVWFIQAYFGTARRWLAMTITLLWVLGLLINFLSPHSLTFIEVSELQHLTTPWGEVFTIPLGTTNPWKLLVDIASLLILVYVGDASVRLWRQGGQRTANVIGGGIMFFVLLAGIHTPLVDAGIIATPYMISFAYLAIIVSMSYQLADDAMRSAQYAQELQQSQQAVERLARANLLGELTSTLAHELNQPLSAILSNAQAGRRLLASKSAPLAEIGDILDDIVRDDQRAADIIQRLRKLLQAGEAVREPLDINAVLQESISLLNGEFSQQQVSPILAFGKGLPDVLAGRTEIQQVVINLISNALNALRDMPVDRRQLVISTTRQHDMVRVMVRDNGMGIAEEDLPRIFEAFFTRKSDGLGMGLAIARRIVEAYGGRIVAESTPAGGATFTVILPVAPGEQEAGDA